MLHLMLQTSKRSKAAEWGRDDRQLYIYAKLTTLQTRLSYEWSDMLKSSMLIASSRLQVYPTSQRSNKSGIGNSPRAEWTKHITPTLQHNATSVGFATGS